MSSSGAVRRAASAPGSRAAANLERARAQKQTLQGPFSAVSKPIFARKYSLESSWRDLHDLHAFAPLRPQYFRKFSSRILAFFHKISNNIFNSQAQTISDHSTNFCKILPKNAKKFDEFFLKY